MKTSSILTVTAVLFLTGWINSVIGAEFEDYPVQVTSFEGRGTFPKTPCSATFNPPLVLTAPATVNLVNPRTVGGYIQVDFEAEIGAEVEVLWAHENELNKDLGKERLTVKKKGLQTWYPGTRDKNGGVTHGQYVGAGTMQIKVTKDSLTLHRYRVVSTRYPFIRVSSFACSDQLLTQLWGISAYTLMQLAGANYQDGLNEKAEWMGDAARVHYPATRVLFAGRRPDGSLVYGDPALAKQIVKHVASTQLPDGQLKSNYPGSRGETEPWPNYVIDDYSCLWLRTMRTCFDQTGDSAFVEEIWPTTVKQLDYWLSKRTDRGLYRLCEFVIFDNPMANALCEGATVNAHFYGALKDAAHLSRAIGKKGQAVEYDLAAQSLYKAFNEHLWDGTTYRSKVGTDPVPRMDMCKRNIDKWAAEKPNPKAVTTTGEPTMHSALFALAFDLVPTDRLKPTRQWLMQRLFAKDQKTGSQYYAPGVNFGLTMAWVFDVLHSMDDRSADQLMLDIFRQRFGFQTRATVTQESLTLQSRPAHCFGAVCAMPLSAYVLGVRNEAPVWEKRIVIEPRLGDLSWAKGVVVTEHGLSEVSWEKESTTGALSFLFEVPAGVTAKVGIPRTGDKGTLVVDGVTYAMAGTHAREGVKLDGRFVRFEIGAGKHTGKFQP